MMTKPPLFTVKSIMHRTAGPISRDKSDMLLLLATCTLVLFPHAGHLPGWVLPVCGVLLAWRGWVTFRGIRMPSRWLLLPIAALAMAGVYMTYRTFFGREAGVAMLALLLTLKLLEMHAKRDLFVVLFLSFFLILSSFFYSQSIGTAAMTLAAALAILTTQLSFQYTGVVPPLTQRLRTGATILALAAPVTLVLFLLFPRIQGPLWGLPGDAQSGRTGLSETMAPGNISKLAQSDEVAFRVKFIDPPPTPSQLYWRGVVLAGYDGRTWSPIRARFRINPQLEVKVRSAPIRYQVTLEPHGRRWVFALEVPRSISDIADSPVLASYDMQFVSAAPINDRVRYDAVSHLDYDLQPVESLQILKQSLELPPGFNPRTFEFAADLRKRSANDAEVIKAALRLFREQNFRYTLEPPPLGKHMVDEFLFTTRAGFCEHYSAAFVVLMRAAGIPARVVTGYQGGELNPADDFMTVRQSDAHAWAEVWQEKRGWVRVDPTAAVAPNRVEKNLASVIPRQLLGGLITFDGSDNALLEGLRQWRQKWDAVTNAWNQWVLNYTPEQQKNFVKSLGFKDVDWRTLVALMFLLGIAAVAIVVLPLILHQKKRDPIDAVYQALCHRMEKKGLSRAIHEGPRAYGARLTAVTSPLQAEQKAALARFLELYETVRYGSTNTPSAVAVSKLKILLAECR